MKALEKDRTRRYETASSLAMDIQRHLENEPVLASPPSNVYRLQKLVRRNKTVFAAAGAVVAALVVGLGLSLYLFVQEREARRRAVAAEQEQEESARIGRKLTQAGLLISREQLDEAQRIVSEVQHPAAISILNVLGMIHGRRGEFAAAGSNYMRSVELNPTDHDAYHSLAPLLAHMGNREAYDQLCGQMVRQFGNTSVPTIAERMARDCLILPNPAVDMQTITKMTDTAIAAGSGHKYWNAFQFVKGLAEYRQANWPVHCRRSRWLR